MVRFETSAHLKHLNPSFTGLLYLCEQSGGVYSFLIQDFHLHWGIISVKHTSTHRYSFQMHPRPPLWRDALSVMLECAYCGFTWPASEIEGGEKMGVGESMSRSVVFCLTLLQSVTSAGVWVISPTSLWEICCALFMLLVDPRFKLLISCWFQITGSIQKCLIAICLIQEVQTSSESLECCFLYWGWQSRDQGLESAMCTEYSYELLQKYMPARKLKSGLTLI